MRLVFLQIIKNSVYLLLPLRFLPPALYAIRAGLLFTVMKMDYLYPIVSKYEPDYISIQIILYYTLKF